LVENDLERMRAFIFLTENFVRSGEEAEPVLEFEPATPKPVEETRLLGELRDLLFKLRAYQEDNDDNGYALGVEAGMSKASDMLENLIERCTELQEDDELG
jgi:hypothetical protein